MKSDGQFYEQVHKGQHEEQISLPPPGPISCEKEKPKSLRINREELLIIGIVILIMSDKCETDIPLVLALIYVLLSE